VLTELLTLFSLSVRYEKRGILSPVSLSPSLSVIGIVCVCVEMA